MCGIAGILALAHDPGRALAIADAWAVRAEAAIAHRGPDGRGVLRDRFTLADGRSGCLLLLHRRLAVLDPAGGAQPMTRAAAGRTVHLVYNGCLYNHRRLRAQLAARGLPFSSDHADTETLAVGLAERWAGFLPELDGMFALGAWDPRAGRLLLARDHAGEKPLYYADRSAPDGSRALAFASAVPALLALRGALGEPGALGLDAARLRAWLAFGYHDQPPVDWIHAAAPGHAVELTLDRPDAAWRSQRWWTPPARGSAMPSGGCETPATALDALERSVADRLEADVPLGCFLSGGIDSPLIAALARRRAPDLRTFTVRMPDARYDESARAEQVARRLGTAHTTLECDAAPRQDLERLIPQLGLPLGDSSLLPTFWVSRAARSHVTVALSGDGADELFDGYARYRAAGLLRSWGGLLKLLPAAVGAGAHPRSTRARLARLADAARGWGYDDILAIFPRRHWRSLLDGDEPPGLDAAAGDDPSRADFFSYLPDDLLRKVDTASMSVALEVRAPYLSREIVEARLASPDPGHAGRKRLLREAAAGILPANIAAAPKSGFAIPIGEWFRADFAGLGALLRERLLDPAAFGALGSSVPFRPGRVAAMLAEHDAGAVDHSQRLYHLLVLSLWERSLHVT